MPRITSKDYGNDLGEYDTFVIARVAGTSKAATDPIRNAAAAAGLRAWLGAPINVKSRTFGATGDGTTDDSAAIQAAINATVDGSVVFFPAGTYVATGISLPNRKITLIGPPNLSAVLKHKGGATAALFTCYATGADQSFENLKFDGNKSNQSNTHQLIYANNPTRLTVTGCGFQSGKSIGIHVDDGTAVLIERSWFSDFDDSCISFLTKTSAGALRNRVANCFFDRTSNGTANGGCAKFNYSTGGDIVECEIVDCIGWMASTPSGTGCVVFEMQGGNSGTNRVIRSHIKGSKSRGGFAGFSLDRASDSLVADCIAYDADSIGIEIVKCLRSHAVGGAVDGNGNTTSGVTIDAQSEFGGDCSVQGVSITGCVTRGVLMKGGVSVKPNRSRVTGCTINLSANSAIGIEADTAERPNITGNTVTLGGTGGTGIIAYAGSQRPTIVGNDVTVNTGDGIKITDVDYANIAENNIEATGSAGSAYVVQNTAFSRCVGGTIKGSFTQGISFGADGSGKSIANSVCGGWNANGSVGSINTFAVNSGTFGTTNRSLPIEGYAPGNVLNAWFVRLAASYTDWVWGGGVLVGAVPTSGPLFGGNGSMIQVVGDGTANNNVPWALKNGTWTAIV